MVSTHGRARMAGSYYGRQIICGLFLKILENGSRTVMFIIEIGAALKDFKLSRNLVAINAVW